MYNIGVIGLGNRIETLLARLLRALGENGRLAAVMDTRDAETLCSFHPSVAEAIKGAHFYVSAEDMLEKEPLDGVLIGTRCSTHTHYACMVMEHNIPLFLEKPVCTTMEDWSRLHTYERAHDGQVLVSFPLRLTPIVHCVKEIVDSGAIGQVQHVQAINDVPYGGVYYHSWYRDESITGGLFLQKTTHDFDYINYVIGCQPTEVASMGSKQVFKGNKPAGLKCRDCAEYLTCTDSPYVLENFCDDSARGSRCCFAVDTGNHDSASSLVRYDTGMHLVYSQNFFARKHAQKRGAIFLGYEGTVEFDFYTLCIRKYPHHSSRMEEIRFDDLHEDHFGGDKALICGFIDLIKGGHSIAPLHEGLLSALMCLKATESEKTKQFVPIVYPR